MIFSFLSSMLFLSGGTSDGTSDIGNITSGVTNLAKSMKENGIGITTFSIGIVILIIVVLSLLFIVYYRVIIPGYHKKTKKHFDDGAKTLTSFISNLMPGGQDYEEQDESDKNEAADDSAAKSPKNKNSTASQSNKQADYHDDIVGAYIQVSMDLKDICRRVGSQLNCSRVGIYVFHNGNKSGFGMPFFKMSCISDYYSKYLDMSAMRGRLHVDMPLHVFDAMITKLYHGGEYIVQDVEATKAKSDHGLYEYTRYSEVKAIFAESIKGKSDQANNNDQPLAGFIVAEFDHIDTFETDQTRRNEIENVLLEAAGAASVLVGTQYVYKKTEKKK